MANPTTAFGFRPTRLPDPATLMTVVALADYGTSIFIGDAVVPVGSGAYVGGFMSVAQAAAGDTNVMGVVVGVEPMSPDSLTTKYGLLSTLRYLKIVPTYAGTIFEVNTDASIAITDLGNRFDIVVGSGSTTSGISAMSLGVSSGATTGKTLIAIGFVDRPDNDHSAAGVQAVRVSFAESLWINGPGV